MCGRPSATLLTTFTGRPRASSTAPVPRVAISWNPISCSSWPSCIAAGLSSSRTLMNTRPLLGRRVPAASCDFTNASPKVVPMPITSPVDFISGPRMVSTPGNLLNGNTASLTAK